ncbi:D-2-hydroxyacid dehydrogenase [Bacillus sp. MRMR6]|uniref:D-2-hydroxyacid dehydrogenase n=1 Tax=Bacillus sp. MRMR6 TaxID=1928617 RepID=UPI000950EEAD|nr:D-2-hydroxyacid dehydrogenase [Bacillus sp. MRMR6]OLS40506.1 hydroxyacid dehydrogenase [Bacillus sp. MRMR6]
MNTRKLVVTQTIHQDQLDQIQEIIPDWKIIAGKDKAVWEEHLQSAEVIAGWKKEIKEKCLQTDSQLKWLQTWSAGVDSLPLDSFEARNIAVTSANGVHSYPISETIFALMLGLTRKIHTYVRNQQAKVWHHGNMNLELHEKTIAIIGVGAIGKEVARLAKAFRMKVIGVRHSGKPEEFVDEMYTTEDLTIVLSSSDYVIITLPLTKETNRLFGADQFNEMKPSAFLINIGRGEIVVEEDLINALQTGKIAGAGLDVFEKEPLDEKSPLWEIDNVIITPHTSGSTEHYNKRVIEDILIPNLKNYVSGTNPSINLVDFSKGY